jgi:hypothetical protein
VVGSISGFSLRHLMASAKKHQPASEKPIHMSFISCGPAGKRNIVFSPAEAEALCRHPDETDATEYYYNVADFLPLLSYDHGNKAMLDQTINEITKLLEARPTEPQSDTVFHHPSEIPPDGGLLRPGTSTDTLAAAGHRTTGQEA